MKHYFSNQNLFAFLLAFFLVLPAFPLLSQIKVTRVADSIALAGRKGIVYNLPRTRLCVELTMSSTLRVPGPLAGFAGDYLGTPDVITKESKEYMVSGARITAMTEPDPRQIYLIEKEEKSQGEIWISFSPGENFMVLERFDKDKVPGNLAEWGGAQGDVSVPGHLYPKYFESSTREVVDTLVRKISIDTLVIEEKVFRRTMVGFSDKEKAQEAVDRIRQLEQDKYNLLIGYQETAYPGDALQFMYEKLEEERIEYMKLFTGVEIRERMTFRFEILPDPGREDQEYVIAGFSEASGILPPGEGHNVVVLIKADKFHSSYAGSETIPTGLVYRLPVDARAAVTVAGEEISAYPLRILQLGPVHALPQEFKKVEFDPGTGMVRKVVME